MKIRNPMKLSDKTISVLKNFSSINQSILFKEGNKLRTISVMKNILAEATISEEFAKDFGVYDLNQFLNGLSLHQRPELDFGNDGYVVIREGKMRSKYFFADPNVIISPPDKTLTLPSQDVCFTLSTQDLDRLLKAAAVYQVMVRIRVEQEQPIFNSGVSSWRISRGCSSSTLSSPCPQLCQT